jgi:hypothetical protein
MENILSNQKDRYYNLCKTTIKTLGNDEPFPSIDFEKDIKIEELETELFKLRAEMEVLKLKVKMQINKNPVSLVDKINQLPEEVQENVMERIEIIVKMESLKVMNYRKSLVE